ncbi:MAG: prepilin-type N-terminal cleavage/methylation domain-containing protein [Syntrophomonadaceae bacterium]|nr:prepilin-type N-terminal cleavage/methylation domain-containing protein [Syntrophomonadaceae bacterium]
MKGKKSNVKINDPRWSKIRRLIAQNEGFTLVELLAVLVILGVLVGIAVPRVSATIQESRKKACEANLQLIERAIERYGMDHINPVTGQPDYSGLTEWSALIPGYFDMKNKKDDKEPLCPVSDNPYKLTPGANPAVSCSHETISNGE